jgi:uncharacterized protein
MEIELSKVGTVPKKLELVFGPVEIELDDSGSLTRDADFNGQVFSRDGHVHVAGNIVTDVTAACARCLEPVESHLELTFDAIFIDSSEEPAATEAEIVDEALDESLVIGGKVDLADIVREQILLAIPEQLFCREDCRGLCPKCGENRNLIDCNCADDDMDPRWAALKNLN